MSAAAPPPGALTRAIRHPSLWVALAMLASTAVVWLGASGEPDALTRYWDGPNYMYTAKTFYRVPPDHPFAAIGLAPSAFATRLPAYPALIRLCSIFTAGDYPAAMLLATLLSAMAAAVLFHRALLAWGWVASPLWTALLFCVLPPRWVVYHSVGATEPLFMACVCGAFLALRRERNAWLIACVALASLTRITGVFLIPVFCAAWALRGRWREAALVPLAGLGLVALFAFHAVAFGDFFAYFTVNSGERGLLRWPPFAMIAFYADHARPHSGEFMIGLYALYAAGTLLLWRQRELFLYCATFFVFHSFVFHDDVSRYLLSLAPFALLVGFDGLLQRPAFRVLALLAGAASHVYAWGVLQRNLASPELYENLLKALR